MPWGQFAAAEALGALVGAVSAWIYWAVFARAGRVVQVVGAQYVVSADGQRFLMNTLVQENSPTPISFIWNWKPRP
jgi:hypothetical protein